VVAFFPILIARVVEGIPLSWLLLLVEVLPWVIGPASVAVVFVWLSTPSQDVSSRPATKTAYVLLHGTAALVGSTVALLLWTGLRRERPDTLAFFLMPIVGALVGAAIGWVLSSTRIQPTTPAATAPGAG
jgi:hypothetical protein